MFYLAISSIKMRSCEFMRWGRVRDCLVYADLTDFSEGFDRLIWRSAHERKFVKTVTLSIIFLSVVYGMLLIQII
jgi:hypothetical protein